MLETTAPPAAPSAPAPASSTPAPAPPSGGTPPAPVAPAAAVSAAVEAAPVAELAAPAAATAATAPVPLAAVGAKYDPQTSVKPPNSADYPATQQGQYDFMQDNTKWALAHPNEAAAARAERVAAEDEGLLATETTAEAAAAAEVAKVEDAQPDAAKPAEVTATVDAATPAAIEEWTAKSLELAAAFAKDPGLKTAMMETARAAEAAKPILEIVSTPEEAQFAVETAGHLVSLQANWMLAGEDGSPEMVQTAWAQTKEMFMERDANGAPVMGPDGKPKLGADFKPFRHAAGAEALSELAESSSATISALEQRLQGVYPNEEAKTADQEKLTQAQYRKAAFDYVLNELKATGGDADASPLPALPPNATPEQIAFQERLAAERAELDAKSGKQTAESRKAARVALDRSVQSTWTQGIQQQIKADLNARKARGEYLPEFVLTDKWINPATGKPSENFSDFEMRVYQKLNAKIESNPLHRAKLGSLQALGAAGKEARVAELTRLTALYLPAILNQRVDEIQSSIRNAKPPAEAASAAALAAGARPEPSSTGTVVPQTMSPQDIRSWAETEAAKEPGFASMSGKDREQLVMTLYSRKRFGG